MSEINYFDIKNAAPPERGDLLISEPYLPDPNFERSVIYLCEHDENGTFGFVLNKPSLLHFDDVMEATDDFSEPLMIGGPVEQQTLHFLHRNPSMMESGQLIQNDVHWGGDFDRLLSSIENKVINPQDFKFFIGYSGWSEGQLMQEIEAKSWIIYKGATATQVFDTDPDVLWRDVLKEMGGKYKMFSNYPTDPRLN
jgi:putative transcriptional regulator